MTKPSFLSDSLPNKPFYSTSRSDIYLVHFGAKPVAVKINKHSLNPSFMLRVREFTHPYVLVPSDIVLGEADGRDAPFVVEITPYLPLPNLYQRKLSLAETYGVVRTMLRTLRDLHTEGLVHGDVRARNILYGDDHHPFLFDFNNGSLLAAGQKVPWFEVQGLGELFRELTHDETPLGWIPREPIPSDVSAVLKRMLINNNFVDDPQEIMEAFGNSLDSHL